MVKAFGTPVPANYPNSSQAVRTDSTTAVLHTPHHVDKNDKVTSTSRDYDRIVGGIVGFIPGFIFGVLAYRTFDHHHYNSTGHEFSGGWMIFAGFGILLIALAGFAVGSLLGTLLHNSKPKNNPDDQKSVAAPGVAAVFLAMIGVGVMVLSLFAGTGAGPSAAAQLPQSDPGLPVATDGVCSSSWVMAQADNTDNKWINGGLSSIRDAETKEAARAAANEWLAVISTDPVLLVGANKTFFGEDVDPATLVDSNGCATLVAIDLNRKIAEFFTELAITPDDVTEEDVDAYNTGVNNRIVIGATEPGIRGDLSAIKLTHPDGRVFWILARCANIVVKGIPQLPPGTTDNPPAPPQPVCEYNPALPPNSPDCVPPNHGKKAQESTSVNPLVDPWITDGGEQHFVNNNDGASDPQGYQSDPQGDAEKAQQAAEEANRVVEEAHEESKEEAVDTGGGDVNPGPVETEDPEQPDW